MERHVARNRRQNELEPPDVGGLFRLMVKNASDSLCQGVPIAACGVNVEFPKPAFSTWKRFDEQQRSQCSISERLPNRNRQKLSELLVTNFRKLRLVYEDI